ncbi:hypothetical protein [Halosimplex amylolyticum]|uniref:hypothetical protein n=1 Tax=Halosimplex amylolyticum TaxID=3396616 RepID=UPI003F572D04
MPISVVGLPLVTPTAPPVLQSLTVFSAPLLVSLVSALVALVSALVAVSLVSDLLADALPLAATEPARTMRLALALLSSGLLVAAHAGCDVPDHLGEAALVVSTAPLALSPASLLADVLPVALAELSGVARPVLPLLVSMALTSALVVLPLLMLLALVVLLLGLVVLLALVMLLARVSLLAVLMLLAPMMALLVVLSLLLVVLSLLLVVLSLLLVVLSLLTVLLAASLVPVAPHTGDDVSDRLGEAALIPSSALLTMVSLPACLTTASLTSQVPSLLDALAVVALLVSSVLLCSLSFVSVLTVVMREVSHGEISCVSAIDRAVPVRRLRSPFGHSAVEPVAWVCKSLHGPAIRIQRYGDAGTHRLSNWPRCARVRSGDCAHAPRRGGSTAIVQTGRENREATLRSAA